MGITFFISAVGWFLENIRAVRENQWDAAVMHKLLRK
jgi:hypothetical protein